MTLHLVRHLAPLVDKGMCYGRTDLEVHPATIAEQACPGDVVRVRVRRRSNNGYQVELLPGADAFVPLAHCPAEIEAERDDVLAARIVRLDVGERRIVEPLADAPQSAEGARPLRLYADGPVFLASDGVAAQRAASELDRSEEELSDVRERLQQAIDDADEARAERDRVPVGPRFQDRKSVA